MSKAEDAIKADFSNDETQDDAEILSELLERTAYMLSRWGDIRDEGDLNMEALSMKGPWPEAELTARQDKSNPRPHGHTDIISQYNNRVVNQWRMNPRGVKVDPSGEGADKTTAELRESRLREIAYSSQAKAARQCALQNAVDRGYGVWEAYADWISPKSFKQTLVIGRIPNPNSVLIDPDTTKADRSDMKYALKMGQPMQIKAFQRKYPKAKDIASFPPETLGLCKQFTDGKTTVTPAEYFRVVTKHTNLLLLSDGREVCEDELADGIKVLGDEKSGRWLADKGKPIAQIVRERETEKPTVEHFVTNGLEILKRSTLPISTIPIFFTVAREKYVHDVLTIEAMTSKMREPQLNFDVARAGEVEALNMVPKSKWVVSDQQILGYEDQWQNAHRSPQAYLMVHEFDRDGRPMAHPERTDFEPPIQGYEIASNSFLRDMQNTVGMAAVQEVDRVSKSGKAQEKIEETGDVSNFHITDNMLMVLEYEGRVCNEWLAHIEDSERTVGLRKPDGKYRPFHLVPKEDESGNVQHPYGAADSHAVTISTGPDYESQRAEKVDFLTTIVKTPDFLANPLAPMVIHEMELGPGGDKMEKIALSVQPPPVQAAYADGDEGQEPMPPQAMQALQQKDKDMAALDAYSKQLEQKVIELEEKIAGQVEQNASREKIAEADNATKIQLQQMKQDHDEAMKKFEIQLKQLDIEHERLRGSIAFATKDIELGSKEGMQERQLVHASQENAASRDAAAQESEANRIAAEKQAALKAKPNGQEEEAR